MSGRQIADHLKERIQASREQSFTGLIEVDSQKQWWLIYLVSGQIVWIRDKNHTLHRWKRHLGLYSQDLLERVTQHDSLPSDVWNYAALSRLVRRNQLPEQQLSNIVESVIAESLFDIFQAGHQQTLTRPLICRQYAVKATGVSAVPINQDRAWREASDQWQSWVRSGLSEYSPDWGLEMVQTETLRVSTTPQMFRSLKICCERSHSLRDLALKFRQPIVLFTQSILPYVRQEMIEFTHTLSLTGDFEDGVFSELFVNDTIDDRLKRKIYASDSQPAFDSQLVSGAQPAFDSRSMETQSINEASLSDSDAQDRQIVVYIDDSPSDSRLMSRIVTGMKYPYINISDPIQALPALLEMKPALIFLDLVMPTANGYELCAQIRRMSAFKQTPIIIVTSNDGVADRVRAKLVGASGFLGKPIRLSKVVKVVAKYLREKTDDEDTVSKSVDLEAGPLKATRPETISPKAIQPRTISPKAMQPTVEKIARSG